MKKIAAIAILVICFSLNCLGQLSFCPTSNPVLYRWGVSFHSGVILKSDGYFLFGHSDNRFEAEPHSIYLGSTSDEAVRSLNELDSIRSTLAEGDTLEVGGMYCRTLIYKNGQFLCFQSQGVAGRSDCISYLNIYSAVNIMKKPSEL